MECKICGRLFNGQRGLSSHLRQSHDIKTLLNYKEYYNKYILNEDITCPICKKHERKFIAFDYGYSSTCIGQKDENGKPLTCRFIWNNKDKEKASRIQIETIKKLKETPSEIDLTKSVYDIQKNNWYKIMIKKNEEGKNKFDIIGEKVSIDHLTIDPLTGKTKATAYAKKAADNNRKTIMPDGRTKHQHISQKSANTVSSILFPDGRTQKEHMTDKANKTRETILPNGLSIAQDVARRAYETKVQNGTLPKYYGYSKMSETVFINLIRDCHLDFFKCFFAGNEKQFINSENQSVHHFDFTYINDNDEPIIIIEFQGNQYHLRESELESRKNDKDPHGNLLIEGFERDRIKKQYIQITYPICKFFYIWEDTIESDIKYIIECIKTC
jgi:hypothetical protein